MNLISIQSHVVYGHVGNSAAVFALQRMGVEVWPIHTVQFPNHTGYGKWQGRVFDAGLIRDLIVGLETRGVLVGRAGDSDRRGARRDRQSGPRVRGGTLALNACHLKI